MLKWDHRDAVNKRARVSRAPAKTKRAIKIHPQKNFDGSSITILMNEREAISKFLNAAYL